MKYHSPVLLEECINGLSINPDGIYVDATFGGGGHSKLILSKLRSGKLFAFDQDLNSIDNKLNSPKFKLINANFRFIRNFLRMEGVEKIDGILADLGISSHQIDVPSRGFSTRFSGDLDMRMNVNSYLTAKDVVNNYSEENLSNLFFSYGELRNSKKISSAIVDARKSAEITTTRELVYVVENLVPEKHRNKFLSKVFQSIRIEVNDEMSSLEEMLLSAQELLKVNGRLVVLSYHSLEDRLVKNLIRKGNFSSEVQKDFFGNPIRSLKEINKKVIVASASEIRINSRARSAKLRIASKINDN